MYIYIYIYVCVCIISLSSLFLPYLPFSFPLSIYLPFSFPLSISPLSLPLSMYICIYIYIYKAILMLDTSNQLQLFCLEIDRQGSSSSNIRFEFYIGCSNREAVPPLLSPPPSPPPSLSMKCIYSYIYIWVCVVVSPIQTSWLIYFRKNSSC